MKNVLAIRFSSEEVMQNALETPSSRQVINSADSNSELCQNTGKPSNILHDIFLKR
jgi:hypothetical protein